MLFSNFDLELLRKGLEQSTTNEDKWHFVFMVLGLRIFTCGMKQHKFNYRHRIWEIKDHKVAEIILNRSSCEIFREPFSERCEYTGIALCHLYGIKFEFKRHTPKIENEFELSLGCPPGWTMNEKEYFFIPLQSASAPVETKEMAAG